MLNLCKSCVYFATCGDFTRGEPCDGYKCEPATLEQITAEADATRAKIATVRANADAIHEMFSNEWDAAKEARKAGNNAEAEKHKAKADAALKDVAPIEADAARLTSILQAINNNLRVVAINNALPVIAEEFKKFDGKPYGEKTRQKIADAIKERCGTRAYIDREFYTSVFDSLTMYSDILTGHGVTVYTEYNQETQKRPELLTADNKINGDAFDTLISPEPLTDYIVCPVAYVAELDSFKEAAEEAKNALIDACNNYNSLCSDRNKWLSTYYNLTK